LRSRRGILMLMFDIPVNNSSQRREYNTFKKQLSQMGFILFQESIYVKLLRNAATVQEAVASVRGILPHEGDIAVLSLSIEQFNSLQCIQGNGFDKHMVCDDVYYDE